MSGACECGEELLLMARYGFRSNMGMNIVCLRGGDGGDGCGRWEGGEEEEATV